MFKLKTRALFIKLSVVVSIITIVFWVISSIITSHYLSGNIEHEFASSNAKILNSIARQSVADLKFSDFYQLRRTLHDFFDDSYMDYFALYTVDMKPFATYPATQFASSDIEFIEKQAQNNSQKESIQKFFKAFGHRRFHFQQQVKDENGQVLGYLFMGGRTAWLDTMVNRQILYFIMLGFLVLLVEIGVLIYFANKFTKPLVQLTKTLKIAQDGSPADLIPVVLSQPPLEVTCEEVGIFDSVVRKLLQTIQNYQRTEMELKLQATLGRLTAHFAHDIRSPISGLIGYLNLRAPKESEEAAEKMRYIIATNNLKKIDRMADELTTYTKAHEVHKHVTDIKDVLEDVQMEQTNFADKVSSQIETKCEDLLAADIDIDKINRVLNNMVLNALQAVKPNSGGMVKVEALKRERDLIVTIEDNGCGIKPEHILQLFDSTFTYGKVKGTGLGLAYCKNVIDAHGGRIEVVSKEGEGSKFTITLSGCVRRKSPKKEETKTEGNENLTNGKKQWLVVDDTPEFRDQWREMIKKNDLPPPIEFESVEALYRSDTDYSELAGAIIDYYYEGSNTTGLDALEYLKAKGVQNLHLCTGNYNESIVIRGVTRFKARLIQKPIPEGIADPKTGLFANIS